MLVVLFISCILNSVDFQVDTVLDAAGITAAKLGTELSKVASPVVAVSSDFMSNYIIDGQKSLSGVVPGLDIPDYGASLTSTIYVRGFGSRMENPVIGLYVDDIPVLDKNAYSFDYDAVRSAIFLEGPQGTMYGRNSMCGVLSAGLRLDCEGTMMSYDCSASVDYRLEPIMPSARPFRTEDTGRIGHSSVQLLPKLSAIREFRFGNDGGGISLYGSISQGYRADGVVPLALNGPVERYMVTGLAGSIKGDEIEFSLNFGDFPTKYRGTKISQED